MALGDGRVLADRIGELFQDFGADRLGVGGARGGLVHVGFFWSMTVGAAPLRAECSRLQDNSPRLTQTRHICPAASAVRPG